MHATSKILPVFFLAIAFSLSVQAQTVTRWVTSEGETYDLREVGAFITLEGEQVKVAMVMPKEARPKAYREVDIQQGDMILYLNGKRIKTVKDFAEKYNELAIGDTMKIGVRRKDERFIVAFSKADPKELPAPVMRKVMVGPDGKIIQEETSGGQVRRMVIDDANGREITPVPGLGWLIGSMDGKVKIINKLPIPSKELENIDIQEGDVLQMLNGEKIAGVGRFVEMYDKIAVGAQIELKYARKEKVLTASFTKPQAQGNIMIRTR
jgi:S1-C subfamily serine protease